MCGICGVVAFDSRDAIDGRLVPEMCQVMRYRGPDGIGFLRRSCVHLGHVRLSIIDLAKGQQPMSNEDSTVHVVYNGEIYNYRDLRSSLESRGHIFRTNCDTEVLVHLYEDYGRDLMDHLVGEFAFAVWDDRTNSALVVRDRLGVKPLFYAVVCGRLYFASEMTPLLLAKDIPRCLDQSAIQTYLDTRSIPAPRTVYKDVRKLLPGHRLEVKNGRVDVTPYWDVRFEPDESRNEDDWADELRALIDESVKGQLMSDVPLGAFLSGGVDSSTIVTSMVRQHQGVVKTFSIGFEESAYDESRYYKLLAQELGIRHYEFIFRPNLVDIVSKVAHHFGEPCAIGSALPLYFLSKLAREHVTVVLSGDGADEVFAGYNVYNFLNWIRILDKWGGRLVASKWIGALLRQMAMRTTSRFGNAMRRARKVHQLLNLPAFLRRPLMHVAELRGLEQPLLLHPQAASAVPEYAQAFQRVEHNHDWLRSYLYADIKTLLPDEMFTKLDRMTMANSMEARVPLVDYRLVELAGRMPSRMKLKRGEVKAVLKRAQRDRLPQAILARKKVGFEVPLNQWFRGPLRSMACDLLGDTRFQDSGLFSPAAVSTLLERHMNEVDNHGTELLSLVAFETWRRDIHERAVWPPAENSEPARYVEDRQLLPG